ncbi:MAG: glycosyltransferase [Deltaproteobacteria bacterium]|jgi:glycosyltransferase involved in cell wall biosynthesis|nr:glycosyltransferase [Deltaproteobacteria bacterium]
MGSHLITVVIPARDRAWCLPRAVDSVLSQKEAPGADFELIVVDDGSLDETGAYLDIMAQSGELVIIANPRPKGVSAARNQGIRAANGDLVAFLDSDDRYLPGKLSAQRAFMDEHPELMLSQCQERWYRGGKRVNPGLKHLKKGGDIFVESLARCLVSPSAAIVRRDLFSEIGYFDESLPACEDYDFWLRAMAAGYEVGLLDKVLTERFAGHPDQLSARPGLDRYRIRSLKGLMRLPLSPERRGAVEAELEKRKAVYEAGRVKRAGEGRRPEF